MKYGKISPQGTLSLANGGWELLSETNVTEDSDSITISGLSGDTDEVYLVKLFVVNNSGGGRSYYMQFGTATVIDTGSNYGYQRLVGVSGGLTAGRNSATSIQTIQGTVADGEVAQCDIIICAKSGVQRNVITSSGYGISGTTVTGVDVVANTWNNTPDEINDIKFVVSASSAHGIGSNIQIWRKI